MVRLFGRKRLTSKGSPQIRAQAGEEEVSRALKASRRKF